MKHCVHTAHSPLRRRLQLLLGGVHRFVSCHGVCPHRDHQARGSVQELAQEQGGPRDWVVLVAVELRGGETRKKKPGCEAEEVQ